MKVIAEIGSNFETFNDLLLSARLAKSCRADFVKFQYFSHHDLYGYGDEHPNIPLDDIDRLASRCEKDEINFMCSAFSPKGYDDINQFVKIHKIASAELSHKRILQKVNSFKKPVLLSTGASGRQDIAWALNELKDCDVTLMYCVSAYPARMPDLRVIKVMQEQFKKPVGFSDHTTDVLTTPFMAMHQGAVYLEKHVDFVGFSGADSDFSLNEYQFRSMVLHLKGDFPVQNHYTMEETPMIEQHNRRLIATKDINVGDVFSEENVGIFRSSIRETNAISGFMIDEIIGRKSTKTIFARDGIGPDSWS